MYDKMGVLCYDVLSCVCLKHVNEVSGFMKGSKLCGSAAVSSLTRMVFRWISHCKYLVSV